MKKRVLVVENDEGIKELIDLVLKDAGYETKLYHNEANMINHIVKFQPDAIILDIVRPTIEGTELCRQISQAEGIRDIPIIVLSTHPKIEVVKEICADEVVHKPFDIDFLVEVLKDQLK